jgi:hypothetical protein
MPVAAAGRLLACHRILDIPLSSVFHAVQVTGVHTVGTVPPLTVDQRSLLALGASFVETPTPLRKQELGVSMCDFFRRAAWRLVFNRQHRPMPPLCLTQDWRGRLVNNEPFRSTIDSTVRAALHAVHMPGLLLSGLQIQLQRRPIPTLLSGRAPLPASHVLPNVTTQQRAARDSLPPNWVIGPADKNMGLAVMDRQWYNAAVLSQLQDATTFELSPLAAEDTALAPARKAATRLSQSLVLALGGAPGDSFEQFLRRLVQNGRASRFYVLPKLHKSPAGIRPISPMHDFPTTPFHVVLCKLLQHHVARIVWCLFSGVEVISKIAGRIVPKSRLFWTADIISMYTRIPLDRLTSFIEELMRRDPAYRCLDEDLIRELVRLVLHETCVTFAGRFYMQRRGIPMGSAAAPVLANLYVSQFETQAWREAPDQHDYCRYIDDLYGEWAGSRTGLQHHLDALLPVDSGLQLDSPVVRSAEELLTRPLPYLDLELYAEPVAGDPDSVRLQCRPYSKQMSAHQYVAYRSGHPASVKRSVVRAELIRQRRLCTTESAWQIAVRTVARRFVARGYTHTHIINALEAVPYSGREESIKQVLTSFAHKRSVQSHPWALAAARRQQAPPATPSPVILAFRIRYDPRVAPAIRSLRQTLQALVDTWSSAGQLPDGSRVVIAFTRNKNLLDWLRRHNNATADTHADMQLQI